jgi:DNA-binding transcriptional LysR family regulator
MNVSTVKYFLAVCKERNFTRAAEASGISQPTLSVAIRRLERELGGALFDRTQSRNGVVHLTELAREVQLHFRAIARNADQAFLKCLRHKISGAVSPQTSK